jgi:hypothetical protein
LIIKENVPGSNECYFLVNDISCMRIPPVILPIDKKEDILIKKYKRELENFYYNYDIAYEIENKTIIQSVLLDKDVFSMIKSLREKKVTVNECLNILNNREELFNDLLDKKFIYETKGFVYIFSDVRFIKFKPYYIIKKIVERYQKQEISLNEYLAHLKLLSEDFQDEISLDYEIV